MQLRHLRTFAAVASTLNVTRAAERIHLAQSSVTEQIQALEADLGAALFDRSRRGLALTEAGRRLQAYADELLALADEARAAVSEVSGRVAGRLVLGGLETLCAGWLPTLIATFRSQYPHVELSLRAGNSGFLRAEVKSGALDASFVFGEALPDPVLRSEPVGRDDLVVIVPPDHALGRRVAIGPGDLAAEPFLVTEPGCVYRRMFEAAFVPAGQVRPPVAGEFGSLGAIRALVEAGAGCALVPRVAAAEAAAAGRLVALPWAGGGGQIPITMIWRRRRAQSPVLRLFLDAARTASGPVMPAGGPRRHAVPSL